MPGVNSEKLPENIPAAFFEREQESESGDREVSAFWLLDGIYGQKVPKTKMIVHSWGW